MATFNDAACGMIELKKKNVGIYGIGMASEQTLGKCDSQLWIFTNMCAKCNGVSEGTLFSSSPRGNHGTRPFLRGVYPAVGCRTTTNYPVKTKSSFRVRISPLVKRLIWKGFRGARSLVTTVINYCRCRNPSKSIVYILTTMTAVD